MSVWVTHVIAWGSHTGQLEVGEEARCSTKSRESNWVLLGSGCLPVWMV